MILLSFDVGTVHLAYCLWDSTQHKILEWKLMTVKGTNACKGAKVLLDSEGQPQTAPDRILVERQPGKNKRMLRMEAYLHMYYSVKFGENKVDLYSPLNKLRDTGLENHGRDRSDYVARKKASVALVKNYLKEHPQDPTMHQLFDKSKKKDDLADALLQAISYVDGVQTIESPTAEQTKRVIHARKPTEKQERTGKYSASNIKHLIQEGFSNSIFMFSQPDPEKAVEHIVRSNNKLSKSVDKQYMTIAQCIDELGLREWVTNHLQHSHE